MDFLSLLTPLLGVGANLLGTVMGNQTNDTVNKTESVNSTATTGIKEGDKTALSNKTNQTTSRLDPATQALLTQKVQQLLNSAGSGQSAVAGQLSSVTAPGADFDPHAFVAGIMKAATSNATYDQESSLNKIASSTGGTADTNSAAALLSNRVRNATADNLAGVQADATARGQEILKTHADTISGLAASQDQGLNTMIGALLQGQETTAGTQNQAQTTQQVQQQIAKTKQTTKTNGKSGSNKNDFEDFFGTLAKAFGSNFVPSGT